MKVHGSWTRHRWIAACCAAAALALAAAQPAHGQFLIEFDTELVEMSLSGGPFPLPIASDPGNNLGDSIDGYGFVDSLVEVTLSSQRASNPGPPSLGHTWAHQGLPAGPPALNGNNGPEPINPEDLDGELFFVESFFDVFFDITVTDVDPRPGRDYAGQPDGASVLLPDNGPANTYGDNEAIFDKDAPSFGLIPPPEADPWIGWFLIEIPLGGDINGNGENDKIKFTLATFAVADENRQFIVLPDGTVLNMGDMESFLEGAIVDESADPPFTIGGLAGPFGGPFTMTSKLLNPIVPEPATLTLLAAGAVALLRRRRKG
ncbi:MAG TPA: PEP-CTERM sorting domain-containing protein [Phycisphaerae bacterium]|nr:PEP-CTERM sorting domain-containing protein [Phycisphaerae bacterium]